MAGTCILPVDILRDDPYFSKEKHVFSRAEALAWIAANVRYVDNCTLKKWQESWSLRYLANAWGWTVKRVRCFLKACENRGFIRTSLGHIKGTAQIVITYMVQRLNWSSDEDRAQVGAQQGHSKGTNKGGKETQEKKEDSCHPQADDDPFAPDPSRMGSGGAGPSKPASGAGCTNPDPQPAESQQAAPNGAGHPRSARADRWKPGDGYPESFEVFWGACPKRCPKAGGAGGKADVYRKWRRLKPHQQVIALRSAEAWASKREGQDAAYTQKIIRWWNEGCWETAADDDAPRQRYEEEYNRFFEEMPA